MSSTFFCAPSLPPQPFAGPLQPAGCAAPFAGLHPDAAPLQPPPEPQAPPVALPGSSVNSLLKTDAEFGKDYEGNKKKVLDYVSGHLSESDMAEFKKFGFDKSPALNRMILGFVNEIEDAKIVGKGQPAPAADKQPKDRWGNTMFDFTKKQQ